MFLRQLAIELASRGLGIDDVTRILNSQRSRGFTQEMFPEFLDAVRSYTSGSGDYSLVNGVLRGSYTPSRTEDLERARRLTALMDEIMFRAPKLEEDMVTFRGIEAGPEVDTLLRLRPGQSFTDRGFGSTSMSQNIAGNFAGLNDEWDTPGILMRITNPVGSSGLFPSAFRGPHQITDRYDELEYILPRNTVYEITGTGNNFLDVVARFNAARNKR